MSYLYFPDFHYKKHINIKILHTTTLILLFNSDMQTPILEKQALSTKSLCTARFLKPVRPTLPSNLSRSSPSSPFTFPEVFWVACPSGLRAQFSLFNTKLKSKLLCLYECIGCGHIIKITHQRGGKKLPPSRLF